MRFKTLIAVLLVHAPLLGLTQTPKGTEVPENAGRAPKLLFRTLGVGVNESGIFYLDKNRFKPCSIDSERRSPYFDRSSLGGPLYFVRSVTGSDGQEQRIAIAQADIDPLIRRALLIFTRASQSDEKLQVTVLKEDLSAVPPGAYRVLNFLPVPTEIMAGTEKQNVPAGGTAVITPQLGAQMNVYVFKVFGLNPKSQAPVPLYSNVYAPDKSVRYLVLIFPSPLSPNQVDVKCLEESVHAIRAETPEQQPALSAPNAP